VVAFVAALPTLRDVINRPGRESYQLTAQVNCAACWEYFHEGDLILLHDEYEGQGGSVMHGICNSCMRISTSGARRRRRVHKCPLCREPCSPAMALETNEEEDTINLTS